MVFFEADYLQFFKELAGNNNKDWFDLNRKRYEKVVKEPFKSFIESALKHFSPFDKRYTELTPSECIFRINRDIRFSKDKAPYKLFNSAVIAPSGKKSPGVHGIYFELGPESFNIFGGIYSIEKEDLYLVREGIMNNLKQFQELISAKDFVTCFGEIQGDKNKIIDKEFKEAALTESLIMNKQWYFLTKLDADIILSDQLLPTLEKYYKVAQPLEQFFNQFIVRN